MPVSQDHGAGQMKLCMEYSSIMLCSELSTQRLEEATAIITFLSSCVSCRIRSGTVPLVPATQQTPSRPYLPRPHRRPSRGGKVGTAFGGHSLPRIRTGDWSEGLFTFKHPAPARPVCSLPHTPPSPLLGTELQPLLRHTFRPWTWESSERTGALI